MASPPLTAGATRLTRGAVNGFRLQVAVGTAGRAVLAQAAQWLYRGGPCVKAYFLGLGHQEAEYRRVFNSEQRAILESGAPFEDYGLPLLFLVLQRVCGLAGPGDPAWACPPAGQPLEHLLHKLSQKQISIARSEDVQLMSDQKLKRELGRLRRLLSRILRLAGSRCGIPPHVLRDEVWQVKQDLQDLTKKVREPLQSFEMNNLPQLQQEIQVFRETLWRNVQERSRQELRDLYPQLWDVALAHWLYPELTVRPSMNFTNLLILENTAHSQEQSFRDLSLEDILQIALPNGSLPEVILISGEGGIGKTTLLKYMLEMWVRDPLQIKGLQDVSPLLYLQLRGSTISSWKDLLKNVLCDTFQESGLACDFFVDLFREMQVVVLLDGYDEVTEEAQKLVTDLATHQGSVRVVITTRPSCLKELSKIVNKKQVMHIEIRGIRQEDRPHFVESTLAALVQDPLCRSAMEEKVTKRLQQLALAKVDLAVPLTLVLLIMREVEAPGRSSYSIYEDLTNLMAGKIEERLVVKGIDEADDKIKDYHEFQKAVALRCLKKHEHDLLPETVEALIAKCNVLDLPYMEILSGFLISKKCRQGLFVVQVWSFPHNRFQEHWASSHIATQLSKMSRSLPDMTGLLDFAFLTDVEKKKKLGMPGLPTEEEVVTFMFTKNPILQVYVDNIEEAKELVWRNIGGDISALLMEIVFNIARIFSSSRENLLDKFASAIISFILYSDQSHLISKNSCHRICETVMASGHHASILEAAAKVLSTSGTLMTRGEYLPGFVALFDYVRPSCVEVFMSKDTEEFPPSWQVSGLEALSKQNIELILTINDIKSSIQFSEACLRAVTGPGSFCRLTKFGGELTEVGMQLLPESLEELNTKSDAEGVRALVPRLQHLQRLQTLDFKGQLTAAEVSLLPRALRKLSVETDAEGFRALAARLPRLEKLQELEFEGHLTEAEMPLLPEVLFSLRVRTDAAGLRALARRLPRLTKLFSLNVMLLDCPLADSLSALPCEVPLLTLDLQHVTPPSWEWVCDAVQVLCSARRQEFRVDVPLSCDAPQMQRIRQELRGRGAEVVGESPKQVWILSWKLCCKL
ncbi:hypothetical protein C7M84_003371 [Penaeus vannamei]|uniref:NACHT domain-containing protein n=1 Tax=Penaeus vannamei TaxID=6689 RepID=A0A3R7N5N5_PENVA|nr:uncharacterized protein LOC113803738 [Penaeus vannamei]XP_027210352.1 uncharacterized protein LOC113803738 [Penaeus vannamei]ROT77930.1 hypothetical protein C7M84_003371 [Penaeus vannamei]